MYKDYSFRLVMLSSVLVWMVIFNHMAESPTFIVAMAGVVIWFYAQKPNITNLVLLILCIVFTCLSPTDIFPPYVRKEIFQPYVIKAVPCILIWVKMIYDLLFDKFTPGKLKYPRSPFIPNHCNQIVINRIKVVGLCLLQGIVGRSKVGLPDSTYF